MPKSTEVCYGGPPNTAGMGICKTGTRTCLDSGTDFGPCVGDVTPKVESCLTPEDDDCDGVMPDLGVEDCATPGDDDCNNVANDHCGVWSERFGGSGDERGLVIAIDPQGNVLIAGESDGSINLGGGVLQGNGGEDVVVAKYTPAGSHLWSKRFGDAADQRATAIATDPMGNVIVAGIFQGSIAFSPSPADTHQSLGLDDVFIVKLDAAGAVLWSKSFGDIADDSPFGVATDANGNVFVTGEFEGLVDFGGGHIASADALDGFLVKLDPSGAFLWAKTFGSTGDDSGQGVSTNAAGDVLITGYFDEEVGFGGPLLTDGSGGGIDIFAAKLDPTGAHIWSRSWGKDGLSLDQYGKAIFEDAAGNIVLTGSFVDALDLGNSSLVGKGGEDIFVAKLDPNGMLLWAKGFGGDADDFPEGVAVDGAGNTLLIGAQDSWSIDFGGGGLVLNGPEDVWVAKLDASGNHVFSRRFGDSDDQDGRGIAANAANEIYITGYFEGTIDFGQGPLAPAGGKDIFLVKLAQ